MIQDKHFYYPHQLGHDDVCARIEAVLGRSPNAAVFLNPAYGVVHDIWRWCLEYGLNPAWPLISLQRERSLLGRLSVDIHDWLYACGYVGQDAAGTKNPRWNGLTPQLWLCIHQTAWIAGFGRAEAYGTDLNLRPSANRWDLQTHRPIQLYTDPNVKGQIFTPATMAQHIIFTYTPHREAEGNAGAILHQFLPEFE